MNPIEQHLAEMDARVKSVEQTLGSLRAEVRQNNARLREEMKRHAVAMDTEFERHAQAVQAEVDRRAAAMQTELEEMQRQLDRLNGAVSALHGEIGEEGRRLREEYDGHLGRLRQEIADNLRILNREISRNTAVFDQSTGQMVEDLQRYQSNVATVLQFVITDNARHDAEHKDLARRVEAIERKLAG